MLNKYAFLGVAFPSKKNVRLSFLVLWEKFLPQGSPLLKRYAKLLLALAGHGSFYAPPLLCLHDLVSLLVLPNGLLIQQARLGGVYSNMEHSI